MAKALEFLAAWKSRLVAAFFMVAAGAVLGGALAWWLQGNRYGRELAELKASRARADLSGANQALEDLRAAGATIRRKADEFAGVQTTLGAQLDAIHKDLKNAKPLPVDCRPDDFRVRKLSDAVDAAKQAAAAR
ncbi:hypothetical protein [Cupriavidus basilensis]|uniref:hypothetical protein n=1 Tax=Cupriavidus basilensis TaxID=68895 RepID=UPI0039F6DEF1